MGLGCLEEVHNSNDIQARRHSDAALGGDRSDTNPVKLLQARKEALPRPQQGIQFSGTPNPGTKCPGNKYPGGEIPGNPKDPEVDAEELCGFVDMQIEDIVSKDGDLSDFDNQGLSVTFLGNVTFFWGEVKFRELNPLEQWEESVLLPPELRGHPGPATGGRLDRAARRGEDLSAARPALRHTGCGGNGVTAALLGIPFYLSLLAPSPLLLYN